MGEAGEGDVGQRPALEGRPGAFVCGGTNLADGELARANAIIETALPSAAAVTGAAVIDGGTDAGVMRLTGQAGARRAQALPVLLSVAPSGPVTYPGEPAADGVPPGGTVRR